MILSMLLSLTPAFFNNSSKPFRCLSKVSFTCSKKPNFCFSTMLINFRASSSIIARPLINFCSPLSNNG